MSIQTIIADIRTSLVETFSLIDNWFDMDSPLREYKPRNGGWNIDEILEHIKLTNHFLLILIDKGANKSIQNSQKLDLQSELANYVFHTDQLTEVGLHKSFEWIRPEHMEPRGEDAEEVSRGLKAQLDQCLSYLDKLQNGEGVLYKTTMSVNGLGKIDVYEYIFFLAQHGRRHITQMEKNQAEFKSI